MGRLFDMTAKDPELAGLVQQATKAGLSKEAAAIVGDTNRLSPLQRLVRGLGAFNPAEAILTGTEKGSFGRGVAEYGRDIFQGVASAVSGRDIGGAKRTFSDVAEKLGVENTIAKYGIGLIGDIFLDPSTYFGGALAKGLVKGVGKVGGKTLSTVGKVAPDVEAGLRQAGRGLKEAAGKAFVFGHGTSKGLPERVLEAQGRIATAKEGIVRSNLRRLGTDTLSKGQQDELVEKLLAGKRAEFAVKGTVGAKEAARAAAQSSDPLVQKTITEQAARSQKFAKQAGFADPFETYFPSLRKDNLKKFFEGTRALKVGSEGYRKQFRNLLTDDELIKNPAEAFAKREFEIARDSIVRSELDDAVRDFGRGIDAFKSEQEALKAGYTLIKEKGGFGKAIGYLKQTDKKFLDNLISPEFTTIDTIAKKTGFDAITALFKRSVTGLFAPFHVRNYVSGLIQNYEVLGPAALNPKNIAIGQKIAWKLARGEDIPSTIIKLGDNSVDLGKAVKAFSRRFGSSSSYISDIADATRGAGVATGKLLSKGALKTTLKTAGLGQQAIPFRAARAVGNFIETQQKATAFVTALGRGKTVKEALELATRAGFDYRALTQFESQILRRLIPFYSFTRKNIELQLKTLGTNPQRINQVIKTLENIQKTSAGGISAQEYEQLPDYAKEQFVVKTGEKTPGLPEVAVGFGTPIEAFTTLFGVKDKEKGAIADTIRKTAATLNPVFKTPLERAFNKDFFRDRPLNEVIEATEYAKAPQFIKDFLKAKPVTKKNKDGTTRVVYNADPKRLQLLRNLPSTRGATYINALFSDVGTGSKILAATTGVKPRPIDLETVEYFRNRDNKRALEDLLIRAGVLKRFEKTYVPKK